MQLMELIEKIEQTYPLFLAESWDNVGLMLGDRSMDVTKIMTVLEVNEEVVEEAVEQNVDLIITHHPFFFSKMNRITSDTTKGKLSLTLIQNNIAVYSMHTSYDIAFDGMNDQFMKRIGFSSDEIFLPSAVCEEWYRKQHNGTVPGLGRIHVLSKEMTLSQLCIYIKEKLGMSCLRFTGDETSIIRRVAVITGAAADYFSDAKAANADVLISGDAKYHIAHDALDSDMNIIDCGHFETENIFKDAMKEFLLSICDVEVISSTSNLNPFQYV